MRLYPRGAARAGGGDGPAGGGQGRRNSLGPRLRLGDFLAGGSRKLPWLTLLGPRGHRSESGGLVAGQKPAVQWDRDRAGCGILIVLGLEAEPRRTRPLGCPQLSLPGAYSGGRCVDSMAPTCPAPCPAACPAPALWNSPGGRDYICLSWSLLHLWHPGPSTGAREGASGLRLSAPVSP